VPIGWDDLEPERASAGLLRARELGITLFDTADVYGLGQSERLPRDNSGQPRHRPAPT
jgi:aryl-alcohol dehydrogenase-like predicted oxidoreductase